MKKHAFDDLTLEEKINHFYGVAKKALPYWGYPKKASLKLLNFTENATFCLTCPEMPKIIMRVHRLDYAEFDMIRTELQWIIDLKNSTDLGLASPLQSVDGNYIETIETPELQEQRHVVCFEYLEGKAPVDSSDSLGDISGLIQKIEKIPDAITLPVFKTASVLSAKLGEIHSKSALSIDDRKLYQKIGSIAATLHKQSMTWQPPKYYNRIVWDFEGTFGKGWNNFYGANYNSRKWLSKKDISTLDRCVELIKLRLEAFGKQSDRYGMIHSDLRIANLLKNNETINVLDFDDCGQGWYMYDIAGAVAFMEHRPDIEEVIKELVTGYSKILPITPEEQQEIWTFIMMRRIGLLEGLIFRIGCVMGGSNEAAELTPEILAFYAKGTVVLAKKYMREYAFEKLPAHSNYKMA